MNELTPASVVRLAPGCRLNPAGTAQDLLLIPEGALRLKGPARSIIELLNGERSLKEVADELGRRYPSEDYARIQRETLTLLERLRERGALEC